MLVGAIDVTTLEAETPDQVADVIRKSMKYISPEKIYPCTNCGMVPLPREVSMGKLTSLVEGAKKVRSEI